MLDLLILLLPWPYYMIMPVGTVLLGLGTIAVIAVAERIRRPR